MFWTIIHIGIKGGTINFMNNKTVTLMIQSKNNTRKLVIGVSTALVLVTALTGCSNQSELLKMINQGDMIEIEIAVPNGVDLSDEEALTWIILASLTSNPDLRASWEDTLKITISGDSKNGCLYVDVDGNQEDNNTLRVALHNRAFLTMLEDTKTMEALALAAQNEYADLDAEDDDKAFLAALNAYYNLLEDQTNGESGMDAKVTRAQFMSMVMRAETQVDESIVASDEFVESVGSSEYNNFASQVDEDCYLSTSYKNLNNKTYNDTMSRGEAVYLIVNHYFHDELELVDTKSASLDDCKDGGDIASKQKFMENGMPKDYYRDYEMVYATQNPDDGAPTDIYRALVVAKKHGLVGENTRWDEGITKYEAIKLLVEAYKQESGVEMFNFASGKNGEHTELKSDEQVAQELYESTLVDDGGGDEEESLKEVQDEADEEAAPTDINEKDYEIIPMDDTTMYAKQFCNVRSGPATTYDKVDSLAQDQVVTVIGKVEKDGKTWYVLKSNDTENDHMVSSSLLSTSKSTPKPSTPSTPSNPTPSTPSDCSSGDCSDCMDCPSDCGGNWLCAPSDCADCSGDCWDGSCITAE